jgi:hypothetical protein
MKSYEIVAAIVARNALGRQLSWAELGVVFELSKDAVRSRVIRFKEKYNIVDADIVPGWNRTFLAAHTPENEKAGLTGLRLYPGDVTVDESGNKVVYYNPDMEAIWLNSDDKVVFGFTDSYDEYTEESIKFEVAEAVQAATKQIIEPLQYLITPAVLVVVRDGKPLTIDKTHKNFEKIQASLEAGNWQDVLDFIDMKNTLSRYSNGRVTVENGKVTLDGEPVAGKVVQRLVSSLLEENLEALEALSSFLDKCDENPDHRVVSRIYDFISHNDLRLDKEGYVLAYKVVQHNYLDKYTSTMDNSPGQLVKMKRNKVNPLDHETCSFGLHVAAKAYIPQYGSPSLRTGGDRVVLCRVNPKDFVSIPTDYNSMKARVCEYVVLKDVTELFVNNELDEGIEA